MFDEKTFQIQRKDMVRFQIVSRGIKNKNVISVMEEIPRHIFVPANLIEEAYSDKPLPIGYNQTISQPYIVALMTELLQLSGKEKVLEIGTGSGYQTAILCKLAKEVYSIDRIEPLVERAKNCLENLGIRNVKFKTGDGTVGWKEYAPYDRIIVTAAAPKIPDALVKQLDENGIMVIPVGSRYVQTMKVIKKKNKKIKEENSIECVFVPLIGKQGWKENWD
jgi:protein-L-isoaspartate(D-aspartate) O-methyltransferase